MLEEKLDLLTKEVVLLRQALEKGGTAAGTKAAEKKAPAKKPSAKDEDDDGDEDEDDKPAKKPAAKKPAKKAGPEHDEDEVGALFRKAAKIDKPRCKKYLAKVDCEDLAELLTDEDKFDAAYAFAEKVIAEAAEAEDEDDD